MLCFQSRNKQDGLLGPSIHHLSPDFMNMEIISPSGPIASKSIGARSQNSVQIITMAPTPIPINHQVMSEKYLITGAAAVPNRQTNTHQADIRHESWPTQATELPSPPPFVATGDLLICGSCRTRFDKVDQLMKHKLEECFASSCGGHRQPPTACLYQNDNVPNTIACAYCDAKFSSAWRVLVHCSERHEIKIYRLQSLSSSSLSSSLLSSSGTGASCCKQENGSDSCLSTNPNSLVTAISRLDCCGDNASNCGEEHVTNEDVSLQEVSSISSNSSSIVSHHQPPSTIGTCSVECPTLLSSQSSSASQ